MIFDNKTIILGHVGQACKSCQETKEKDFRNDCKIEMLRAMEAYIAKADEDFQCDLISEDEFREFNKYILGLYVLCLNCDRSSALLFEGISSELEDLYRQETRTRKEKIGKVKKDGNVIYAKFGKKV